MITHEISAKVTAIPVNGQTVKKAKAHSIPRKIIHWIDDFGSRFSGNILYLINKLTLCYIHLARYFSKLLNGVYLGIYRNFPMGAMSLFSLLV